MNWSDSISPGHPLRGVRLLAQAPVQNWQEHLREREQAAYERGRRDGEQTLNEQLLQQRTETVELQKGTLDSLRRAVPQVIQEAEAVLIELALQSAQKIVADMPINAGMVEAVVREALRQVEDTTEIVIQLHPDDLALLRKHNAAILDGLPETGPLRFSGSTEVTRGGCIVQTRFGLVDARRETKVEQLRQALNA
ncbi:MAG TPA: FliH/SctL family protein [Candidatus Sulfopaludibacter sp.]|nr:FliH/SctL family protein [Candidatus Sulfopaludibacter sp.]